MQYSSYNQVMKITFLGTGSSTPTAKMENLPQRSYSSFVIESGESSFLFDCGPGTMSKMTQNGMDILKSPTHLFITHFHLDHCLDYIALTKARALDKKYGGKGLKIEVFGPEGLKDFTKDLFEGVKKWDYMSKELNGYEILNLHEVEDSEILDSGSAKVTCSPIDHYDGVVYKVELEGKSIVYSGDMGYDQSFAKIGRDADIAIMECSYPDNSALKGKHLSPDEIIRIANLGNFKQIILTHLYPACEGREDEIIEKIESLTNVKVRIAHDFFTLSL